MTSKSPPEGRPVEGRGPAKSATPERPGSGGWSRSVLLGLALLGIYSANRIDSIGSEDTLAAQILPMVVAFGDGPFLDRYEHFATNDDGQLSWSMARSRGHIVTRYPIAPSLLLAPLVAAQMPIFHRIVPDWDRNPGMTLLVADQLTKNASAFVAALTAVALHRLLRRLGLGRVALAATLAAAIGSDLWTVASQAPWQHGPAALAFTLAMLFLTPRPISRTRLVLAGTATAALVAFRPIDAIFAAAIVASVARHRPRDLAWFLPGPLVIGGAVVAYNLSFFGQILGGLPAIEALHPTIHGVAGTWSGHLADGLAGTLLSPNRGLFVFCPWVSLALALLPAVFGRLRAWPLGVWLLGALGVYTLALSKYAIWWAGHSFGPRYWTEAMPLFAVLLGFSLDWARTRFAPLVWAFAAAIVASIGLQAIGAFCFPSTWNDLPRSVDRDPGRLWDWSDTEVSRCLREGAKPWSRFAVPRRLYRSNIPARR